MALEVVGIDNLNYDQKIKFKLIEKQGKQLAENIKLII